jgi:hypothetical protein
MTLIDHESNVSEEFDRMAISIPTSAEAVAADGNYTKTKSLFDMESFDFLDSSIWWPVSGKNGSQYEIYALCEDCTLPDYSSFNVSQTSLHPSLNAIFRDALVDTGNPAVAWQALTTSVLRTAYYDWLPMFEKDEFITTTSLVPCQLPLYTKGFIVVMVNLGLHLFLVIAIFMWFARKTKYSLLNNAWQVVAQLVGPETEKIFDVSTMSDDKTIRHLVKNQGQLRRRFRVAETFNGERVCLL